MFSFSRVLFVSWVWQKFHTGMCFVLCAQLSFALGSLVLRQWQGQSEIVPSRMRESSPPQRYELSSIYRPVVWCVCSFHLSGLQERTAITGVVVYFYKTSFRGAWLWFLAFGCLISTTERCGSSHVPGSSRVGMRQTCTQEAGVSSANRKLQQKMCNLPSENEISRLRKRFLVQSLCLALWLATRRFYFSTSHTSHHWYVFLGDPSCSSVYGGHRGMVVGDREDLGGFRTEVG